LTKCNYHKFFFEWSCNICKEEYKYLKGTNQVNIENQNKTNIQKDIKQKNYKEFNEERAKKLFEEIFLQYLKKGNISEEESIKRSKIIIRKQCEIRGIKPWSWI
jgi:DNA-binding transcriptional regulator YhcF (GntR family)